MQPIAAINSGGNAQRVSYLIHHRCGSLLPSKSTLDVTPCSSGNGSKTIKVEMGSECERQREIGKRKKKERRRQMIIDWGIVKDTDQSGNNLMLRGAI